MKVYTWPDHVVSRQRGSAMDYEGSSKCPVCGGEYDRVVGNWMKFEGGEYTQYPTAEEGFTYCATGGRGEVCACCAMMIEQLKELPAWLIRKLARRAGRRV